MIAPDLGLAGNYNNCCMLATKAIAIVMFLKFAWYLVKFYIANWLFLHTAPFSYPL